jgi:membrane protease YdiL (CAAX protease family)
MHRAKVLFHQFIAFLKKPDYKPEKINTKEKLKHLFWIWLFNLVVDIPLICVLYYLDSKKLIPDSSYELKGTAMRFGAMVIIAPIFEELFFRNPLNSPKWSVGIIGLFLLWLIAQLPLFFGFIDTSYIYAGLCIVWIIAWGGYKPSRKFYISWKHNYQWVFYVFALLFGVVHLTNYNLGNALWWVLPFLCISQMFGGVILGFVRLRYGLQFSILLHALFNFTVFLLSLFD